MGQAFRLYNPPEPGEQDASSGQTVADIVRRYVDEKRLQMRSGAYSDMKFTKTEYYCGSFSRAFGDKEMAGCQNSDFTSWLLDNPDWKSPHTKSDAVGTIVACFRWAEGERVIDRNPYRRPKGLWATPQPRQAIEPAEVRAMLDMAQRCNGKHGRRRSPSCRAFRLALWFLWESGCRTCEMREMAWGEVDWDAGVIRMARHKTDKSGLERIIPLSDRALRLLAWVGRSRREGCAGSGCVFPNGRGRPWTLRAFSRMFRRYADMAGVREIITAYCLRHGFTVQALEAGIGNRQIADVLGHSGTQLVDWYGRGTKTNACYLRDVAGRVHKRKRDPTE